VVQEDLVVAAHKVAAVATAKIAPALRVARGTAEGAARVVAAVKAAPVVWEDPAAMAVPETTLRLVTHAIFWVPFLPTYSAAAAAFPVRPVRAALQELVAPVESPGRRRRQ
jgi:hypothetical protein